MLKGVPLRGAVPILLDKGLGLQNSFRLMQELFVNLQQGSGAVVIAAAAGDEFAYEDSEWRNGAFTYAVLNALKSKSADFDRNGDISVTELRDFVVDEVTRLTGGRQTPTVRNSNSEVDFRVY